MYTFSIVKDTCKKYFQGGLTFLICLQFSFWPRCVRSWAILAQVPDCEVRAQGLEEPIRWLSVTLMKSCPSSPPLLHPFLASSSETKKEKKNSNMMKTSSCRCRGRLGAGCLLHLSLCFATCYIPSPKAGIKQNISRILCYEWGRNVQFAPYLGMRRWNDRDKITLEHLKTGCGCLPSLFCFKQGCLFTVSAAPFL